MQTAHFEYKCRRCDTVYTPSSISLAFVEDAAFQLMLRALQGTVEGASDPSLLATHSCNAVSCGVADLIGYIVTDSQ